YPALPVFSKGNAKLPFWAFSALPIVTCPGAGECARWCYSLTSWRTPGAAVYADRKVQRRADRKVQRAGSRYQTPREVDKGVPTFLTFGHLQFNSPITPLLPPVWSPDGGAAPP